MKQIISLKAVSVMWQYSAKYAKHTHTELSTLYTEFLTWKTLTSINLSL